MFQLHEADLATAVRRVVDEQVTLAVAEVRGQTDLDHDTEVHEARKRCKRVRAVLRLVRAPLGGDRFRHENTAVRDAARTLSAVRDAQVLIDTLDAVIRDEHLDADRLAAVRAHLRDEHARLRQQARDDGGAAEAAAAALLGVAERSRAWPLDGLDFAGLAPGLTRVYGQARQRMADAHAVPTGEGFHAWRKRVKDLWHHMELLTPAWPPVLAALADELHVLSGLLGDEHDRDVLAARTLGPAGLVGDAGAAAALGAALEVQRMRLRADAWVLGARVHAEPPARFVTRIGAYWRTRPAAHHGATVVAAAPTSAAS